MRPRDSKPRSLASTPLIAALAWAGALVADPAWLAPHSVLLVGGSILALAATSVVGMVVVGGRWARILGYSVVAATLVLAVARHTDAWWWAGVAASGLALVSLAGPSLDERTRKLPSATGPPPVAAALPLALLAVPGLIGAANAHPAELALAAGASAPVAALWYARVLPGGLFVARVAWPVLALVAAPLLERGAVLAAVALVIAALAWQRDVKVAFHPPVEAGTRHRIPPELTPPAIRDAAGIDERGRRA